MNRPPRSPRTVRMLDMLESLYLDPALPATERIAAAALACQALGIRTDILITGPNVWRDGLVRLRSKVNKVSRDEGRAEKNRRRNTRKSKAEWELQRKIDELLAKPAESY